MASWEDDILTGLGNRRGQRKEPIVVEDKGEPVYVDWSEVGSCERYYRDVDAAAEAIFDDGGDPTKAIVHPCTVRKAPTPDIAETVEEAWACDFEEPDDIRLSKTARRACEALQELLEAEAPDAWHPRTNERVILPDPNISADQGVLTAPSDEYRVPARVKPERGFHSPMSGDEPMTPELETWVRDQRGK